MGNERSQLAQLAHLHEMHGVKAPNNIDRLKKNSLPLTKLTILSSQRKVG